MPSTKTPRWKYTPPKAEMRATQPNPVLGGISSGLGSFRSLLDALGNAKLHAPPGVPGVGHMMMGTSPEEVGEWARGSSPFSEEPNYGNILDPRIKPGREQGVMDVALTGADIGGLGLAGLRRGVRAAYPTLNPEMNVSRREFMGNTGKAAAGLAVASAVPLALRGAEHVTPHVAEATVAHAIPAAARAAAAVPATHAEYTALINLARHNARDAHYARLDAAKNSGAATIGNKSNWTLADDELLGHLKNQHIDDVTERIKAIKDNPRYAGMKDTQELEEELKVEAAKINRKYLGSFSDVDRLGHSYYAERVRNAERFGRVPRGTAAKYEAEMNEILAKHQNHREAIPHNEDFNYLESLAYERKMDEPYRAVRQKDFEHASEILDTHGGRVYDPETHRFVTYHTLPDGTRQIVVKYPNKTDFELHLENELKPKPATTDPIPMPNGYRAGGRVRII